MPLKQRFSTIKSNILNANGDVSLCILKDKILPFLYEVKFFFLVYKKKINFKHPKCSHA